MPRGGNDDEAVDPSGGERVDELALPIRVAVGAAREHERPAFAGDIVDAAQDRREERVGNIRQDEPDRAGLRGGMTEVARP